MAIQSDGRADGGAKVGTNGVVGSTYVQIYSVLFIAPSTTSKTRRRAREEWKRAKGSENNGRSIPGATRTRSPNDAGFTKGQSIYDVRKCFGI